VLRKEAYIEQLLRSGVLRIGEFKTKSGRMSPFFFNTGELDSGHSLAAVAALYAEAIAERFPTVDNLFGPAYKGIPLAVMTAAKLSDRLGRDISFTFNRKEVKDHGEGGLLVGRIYKGGEKVVVIEDVVTGGTSFNESIPLVRRFDVQVVGLAVGVDRQERGVGADKSALTEVSDRWGVPALSLVTMRDVVSALHNREVLGKVWIDDAVKARIDEYMRTYAAGYFG
jgi:orotate phosphoribosyltransferase